MRILLVRFGDSMPVRNAILLCATLCLIQSSCGTREERPKAIPVDGIASCSILKKAVTYELPGSESVNLATLCRAIARVDSTLRATRERHPDYPDFPLADSDTLAYGMRAMEGFDSTLVTERPAKMIVMLLTVVGFPRRLSANSTLQGSIVGLSFVSDSTH